MFTDHWLIPHRSGRHGPNGLREVRRSWSDLDQLLGEMWPRFGLDPAAFEAASDFSPRVDVRETDDEFRLSAELPGLGPEDFEVSLMGEVLTLKGEKREERSQEREGRCWVETARGRFARSLRLPCEVDADSVTAAYDKGVLTVVVPKPARGGHAARSIPVSTS